LSGIQLVSLIRRPSGLPPIRLIALSGYGRDTDVEEAKAAGFDDYLMKPVEISSLIAAIDGLSGPRWLLTAVRSNWKSSPDESAISVQMPKDALLVTTNLA
jgi:CheY-like chemotaxis protein